jgi:hypothetical protein
MSQGLLSFLSNTLNRGFIDAIGGNYVGMGQGTRIYEFGPSRFSVASKAPAAFGKSVRAGLIGGAVAVGLNVFTDSDPSVLGMAGTFSFMGMMSAGMPDFKNPMKMPGRGASSLLGVAAPLLFSGWNIWNGYNNEGLQGAKDAAIFDVAVAGGASFGIRGQVLKSTVGDATYGITSRVTNKGPLRNAGRYLGAAVGATLGGSIGEYIGVPGGETAGVIGGALLGGAPLRTFARFPKATAAGVVGMAVGAGVATVGKGAGYVVKMANAHQKARRSIQTDGSLAAFMTEGASTMRSRAVQAIQNSHMNARSALGREANFMHYPSKNYHSSYRM